MQDLPYLPLMRICRVYHRQWQNAELKCGLYPAINFVILITDKV
jgi:hypothetical protein